MNRFTIYYPSGVLECLKENNRKCTYQLLLFLWMILSFRERKQLRLQTSGVTSFAYILASVLDKQEIYFHFLLAQN